MIVWTERELRWAGVGRRNPLSPRHALRAMALLTGAHAVAYLVSPGFWLSLFGAPPPGDATVWLRHLGALFAACTIVFWSAASWPSSMMQRPVMWAAGVVVTLSAIIGVLGILDGTVNPLYWVVAGYELLLAIWFGCLLATDGI